MPLTNLIHQRPTGGADRRLKSDAGRGRSGSPDARGPSFRVVVFAAFFAAFGLITVLLPETAPAARIAGEEQPVTTAPAG
jgi:hypothetical protein